MSNVNESLAHSIYEEIAYKYVEVTEDSPYNAYCERPAILQLIGDPRGLRILDAGCGGGTLMNLLDKSGASNLTGFDSSASFVDISRRRCSSRVNVFQAKLEQAPFSELESESFDLVVSSLVMHYVADWSIPLREFFRVLRKNGRLIMSVSHPMEDYDCSPSGHYFEFEQITDYWPSFDINMPSYRRSLTDMFHALNDANFQCEDIEEPRPLKSLLKINGELYEKLESRPPFIIFSARKCSQTSLT